MDPKIIDFLTELEQVNSTHHQMIIKLRDLFFECDSELDEKMMYGGILFRKNGMMIGGLFNYTQHVTVEFGQGYQFDDPKKLLLGSGKYRRHLKFSNPNDIDSDTLHFFIKQAIAIAEKS